MSGDLAVSVRDVVKRYKVRHEKGRTLKEAFLRQRIYSETIHALDHVSFDVPRGATIGLIGSNGSGKSTMLKMIAGTSRPNEGEVKVNGRVSALLELGAGFHPDFSGRENVYLDGIILGLSRREIERRFDDIVRFAEMEEFIDAPAKTYSSGMFMRLAFAVAVSVDPDILLIDEVLAVGDASFQRKCLKRINEIKNQGTTIIYVSHSMDAVKDLCDEAVWLDRGVLKAQGTTEKVVDQYLAAVFQHDQQRIGEEEKERQLQEEDEQRWGTRRAEITGVQLIGAGNAENYLFNTGDAMRVRLQYRTDQEIEAPVAGVLIRADDGTACFGANTLTIGKAPAKLPLQGELELEFDEVRFLPGSYTLSAALQNQDGSEVFDYHDRKYHFDVVGGIANESGVCHLPYKWLNWPAAET